MAETHEIRNAAASLDNITPITPCTTQCVNPIPQGQELFKENDETDIPVDLLEEIVKDGEDSVINPQLDSSINQAYENNSSNTSFSSPAEYLQSFDSIFTLGGQEFLLNNCGQKRLIVGLESSGIPNLKIVFKLHDINNDYCLVFTKKEWNKIIQHEINILDSMNNNFDAEIFYSDKMRVKTLVLYNRPCVKICDIADNHCTLALETFQHMMLLKNDIEETYNNLKSKIKDVTKRMALFMDMTFFLLFKSNNIDNRHNYNRLMLSMNKSSKFLDLSSSVAHTWKELGEWIANESNADLNE